MIYMRGVLILLLIMLLSACEGSSGGLSDSDSHSRLEMTSIQVTPSTFELLYGTTRQLTATANHGDGSTRDITGETSQITWLSSNEEIASIDENGFVTAKNTGQASFYAVLNEGGVSSNAAQATILENQLREITLSIAGESLPKGVKRQLNATGLLDNGSTLDLSAQVTYSFDSVYVFVDGKGELSALAITPDTTPVIASLNGITSNPLAVRVNTAELASLSLVATNTEGFTRQSPLLINLVGHYSDGSQQILSYSPDVTWQLDESQLTLDVARGMIALIGNTNDPLEIKASFQGLASNPLTVTPSEAILQAINLEHGCELPLPKGLTCQLKALGQFSDNSTADLTYLVDWQSEDPSIFTVTPKNTRDSGLLTAVSPGSSLVKLSYEGINTELMVEITEGVLNALSITGSANIEYNRTGIQFSATGHYSDGTHDVTDSVTWASSAPAVATVSNEAGYGKGRVTATNIGRATISAHLNGVEASFEVTVTDPNAVLSLETETPFTQLANSSSLTELLGVYGMREDGSRINLTYDSLVTCSSSDPAVVNVENTTPCRMTAVADSGTADVIVEFPDDNNPGQNVRATHTLEAVPATMTGFTLGLHNGDDLQDISLRPEAMIEIHGHQWYSSGQKLTTAATLSIAAPAHGATVRTSWFSGAGSNIVLVGAARGEPYTLTVNGYQNVNGTRWDAPALTLHVEDPSKNSNISCYSDLQVGLKKYTCPASPNTSITYDYSAEATHNAGYQSSFIPESKYYHLHHQQAVDYCKILGGRLPTLAEMVEIFDTHDGNTSQPNRLYSRYGYPASVSYWTADTVANDPLAAKSIAMHNKTAVDRNKSEANQYAICRID